MILELAPTHFPLNVIGRTGDAHQEAVVIGGPRFSWRGNNRASARIRPSQDQDHGAHPDESHDGAEKIGKAIGDRHGPIVPGGRDKRYF